MEAIGPVTHLRLTAFVIKYNAADTQMKTCLCWLAHVLGKE